MTDLTPDANSLQVVVFYQVCPVATPAAPYTLPYEIGYNGGTPLTATYSEISLSGSDFTAVSTSSMVSTSALYDPLGSGLLALAALYE